MACISDLYIVFRCFAGVTILPVTATDNDDSPDNKKIMFSIISGDPEGIFSMENQESNVGNIVLKSMLDRETQDRYTLVIQAADGGDPAKSTTTMVRIEILCTSSSDFIQAKWMALQASQRIVWT